MGKDWYKLLGIMVIDWIAAVALFGVIAFFIWLFVQFMELMINLVGAVVE
jgi:hypothetical protein